LQIPSHSLGSIRTQVYECFVIIYNRFPIAPLFFSWSLVIFRVTSYLLQITGFFLFVILVQNCHFCLKLNCNVRWHQVRLLKQTHFSKICIFIYSLLWNFIIDAMSCCKNPMAWNYGCAAVGLWSTRSSKPYLPRPRSGDGFISSHYSWILDMHEVH